MENDGLAGVQREVGFVEPGERQMPGARDLLAGMFVSFADIDQDAPLIEKMLGLGRADSGKRHGELRG